MFLSLHSILYIISDTISDGDGSKPWYLVNPKIAGIYGSSSHSKWYYYRYWPIPRYSPVIQWGIWKMPRSSCKRDAGSSHRSWGAKWPLAATGKVARRTAFRTLRDPLVLSPKVMVHWLVISRYDDRMMHFSLDHNIFMIELCIYGSLDSLCQAWVIVLDVGNP